MKITSPEQLASAVVLSEEEAGEVFGYLTRHKHVLHEGPMGVVGIGTLLWMVVFGCVSDLLENTAFDAIGFMDAMLGFVGVLLLSPTIGIVLSVTLAVWWRNMHDRQLLRHLRMSLCFNCEYNLSRHPDLTDGVSWLRCQECGETSPAVR